MTTWDETKRKSNISQHGIDLALAAVFDLNNAVVHEDTSEAYGEPRFRAVGPISDRIYVCVFTLRGDDDEVHAISLRYAEPKERRHYAREIKADRS